jgi:hypothetical protein
MGLDSTPVQARTVVTQDSEPENKDLLWIDTSGTDPVLKQYRASQSAWGKVVRRGFPNPYDAAETFEESEVTVRSLNNTLSVGSGSLSLPDGNLVSRGADNSSTGGNLSGSRGYVINPNTDLSEIEVEIGSNSGFLDEVFIVDTSSNILANDTSGINGGESATLTVSLNSGTDYIVGFFTQGNTRTIGENTSVSYPINGSPLDIKSGTFDKHPDASSDGTGSFASGIEKIGAPAQTDATAAVEWPEPNDIVSWDAATYQRATDGETADVYIAYNDGSGWSRANGGNPIPRDYDLSDDADIAASDRTRIEVELSRADTANNPKLKSAYRSWRI